MTRRVRSGCAGLLGFLFGHQFYGWDFRTRACLRCGVRMPNPRICREVSDVDGD